MSDKDDPDITWLKIRTLPDPDGVPGNVRLRRCLKSMLRAYGLRVERVSGEGPVNEIPTDEKT